MGAILIGYSHCSTRASGMSVDTQLREFEYRDADFEAVRKIIYHKAGISLSDSKKQLVYSRLARRLRFLGFANFRQYLEFLRENEAEQEEFVNALTTNLTAFFREPHHFAILAKFVKAHRQSNRRLRIWCAASSTGEEPYSIAMTLAEAYGCLEPPVEIIASDIDSQVLEQAQNGVYPLARLDMLTLDQKRKFFLRGKGPNIGNARVISKLRELIDFRRINLLDTSWGIAAPLDVIFCRNVMIYFDKPTQIKILERMTHLMSNDGLYVAGHSENFSHASYLVRLIDKTTYQLADHLRRR